MVAKDSSGSWKPIKIFKTKNSDNQWEDISNVKAYFGKDGWHETVPPNAIILYDVDNGKLPTNSLLCDGNNSTPNLLDLYPVMTTNSSNIYIRGGKEKHNGSEHGSSGNITTSSYNHPKANNGTATNKTTLNSHSHTVSSHTHSVDQYHDRPRKHLQPTMFNDVLKKDSVFLNLYDNTFDANKLSIIYYGLFLKFANNNLSNTTDYLNSGHYHSLHTGSVSIKFSYGDFGGNPQSSSSHSHTVNHYMEQKTGLSFPTQNFYTLKTMVNTLYWDELPKGTVVLFTSNLLPKNFEPLTTINGINTEDKFICLGNDLNYNNTSSIYHSHSKTVTTSRWDRTAGDFTKIDDEKNYTIDTHSHTFTDSHSTSVDHRPPFVKLYVGYKTV